jgi:tryptophan synthase alpha chain
LFEQIRHIRQKVRIPIILMGYINPVIQYGMERFLQQCQAIGVDATILPDMPLPEFLNEYQALYEKYGLTNIFLVTPQTSEARIRDIDAISRGFIYMVSSNSITGGKGEVAASQIAYFQRLQNMSLRNPRLIGFGISDHAAFMQASKYAEGAIIGSAFIRLLAQSKDLPTDIYRFVKSIKQGGA